MTTSSPTLAMDLYNKGLEKEISVLDAPVSGGDIGAQKGTLSIMVGGDKEVFNNSLPVLNAMGSNVVYMGKSGSGQHTKMANQIAIAGTILFSGKGSPPGRGFPAGGNHPKNHYLRPQRLRRSSAVLRASSSGEHSLAGVDLAGAVCLPMSLPFIGAGSFLRLGGSCRRWRSLMSRTSRRSGSRSGPS